MKVKSPGSAFKLKGHWKKLHAEIGDHGSVSKKIQILILRQLCMITIWLVGIFAAICVSIFV